MSHSNKIVTICTFEKQNSDSGLIESYELKSEEKFPKTSSRSKGPMDYCMKEIGFT